MEPRRRKIRPPPIPPHIRIRAVCPKCGQSFGSQYGWVTCPECKTEFTHFREVQAVTSATAVPSYAPPPDVPPDSGGGLWDAIQRKGRIYELDRASLRILSCGLVALALLSFSSFLPWASLSSGFFRLNLLGVQTGVGLFVLFLSLGVGIFVGVAFALQRLAFEISVYTGAGWGLFASLWLLVYIVNVASTGLVGLGVGPCFAFLCSLGVAGTFGLVAIHFLRRRASAEPSH